MQSLVFEHRLADRNWPLEICWLRWLFPVLRFVSGGEFRFEFWGAEEALGLGTIVFIAPVFLCFEFGD